MLIELGTDRLSRSRRAVQGTVAGILWFAGANGISPNIVKAEPLIQSTGISRTINPDVGINLDATTKAVMDRLAQLSSDLSQVVPDLTEPLGGTLTKAWIGEDGLLRIADKKMVLKQTLDGKFKPSNMLQSLYDSGKEDLLRYGILGGDPLPSLTEYSAEPTPKVLNTVISLSEYFQAGYFISQSANFGGFNVYNISDEAGITFALLEVTDGPNSGKLTLANITPQIITTGLILQDLVLSEDLIATGGGTPEPIPQPTATPVPQPVVQPTPTPLIFPRYPQIPLPIPDPSYTKRPIIRGDGECVDSVTKALDYIQEKASLEYYLVLSNPRTIECTEQSYATVSHDPPRLLIGRELLKTPKSSLGAVLVHESCHIWQVLRFKNMYPNIWPPPIGTGQGSVAEAECYTVEYYLYKKLGVNFDDLNSFADWVFKRIGIRIPLQ